ncbi:MAG: BMP family protein [Solirubrobacteraceae bacterium]|nr:BMP family protein [Solirubrobacteraceae bacterium]
MNRPLPHPTRAFAATALAAVCAAGALAACGSDDESGSAAGTSTSAESAKPLTVGVLIPGFKNDGGYMQSAYEGLQRAEKEHGDKIKISMIENVASADMPQALQNLASQNKVVISVGGQTDEALKTVVPSFPDVTFSELGGPNDSSENKSSYDPKQAEIAYVAGVAAALSSKTGKIQFVAGLEAPPIVNTATEFANGAKHAKPDIKVLPPAYTGDFEDVAKSKEAALAGIAQGADVQYQILNTGLKGLAQAAKEKGTLIIGGPLPKECKEGDGYLGHTRSDIGVSLEYTIDSVLDGTWKGVDKPFGLNSDTGAADFTLCSGDPKVQAKIDETIADIKSGKIKTI